MPNTKKTAATTTALATVDTFKIANRYEGVDPELLAELQDQMEDLDPESGITCRQIKVPSAGGIAYEVQGEDDGDADPMKEVEGVILFTHRLNGYWPNAYGTSNNPEDKVPLCSSMDSKTGFNPSTGEVTTCENCPLNQYGTGVDDKGNPKKGKACKNMRRIYLMMDGDPNFYLLTVPPTSIKDVNKQLAKILASGTPYTSMIVGFTLEKAQNSNGVAYSKVVVKKKGLLPPDAAAQVLKLRNQIKAQYQSMTLTLDEYTAAPAQDQGGTADAAEAPAPTGDGTAPAFEEAPPTDGGNLPFD